MSLDRRQGVDVATVKIQGRLTPAAFNQYLLDLKEIYERRNPYIIIYDLSHAGLVGPLQTNQVLKYLHSIKEDYIDRYNELVLLVIPNALLRATIKHLIRMFSALNQGPLIVFCSGEEVEQHLQLHFTRRTS